MIAMVILLLNTADINFIGNGIYIYIFVVQIKRQMAF